jgi:hypothetical protein
MIRRFAFVALALLGLAGASAAARADDATASAIWKRYWTAIEVQKNCNNVAFTQSQYDAMTQVINMRINNELGAGVRQQLIAEAKTDAHDLTFKYSCKDPRAVDLLALYNAELAPSPSSSLSSVMVGEGRP